MYTTTHVPTRASGGRGIAMTAGGALVASLVSLQLAVFSPATPSTPSNGERSNQQLAVEPDRNPIVFRGR